MINPTILKTAINAVNKLAGSTGNSAKIRYGRDARYRSDCINITPTNGDSQAYISIILIEPLLIETSADRKFVNFSFNQYGEIDFIKQCENLIS